MSNLLVDRKRFNRISVYLANHGEMLKAISRAPLDKLRV